MKIWVNAQLPPAIANWIVENFDVEAVAVRELNLGDATDPEIFAAAKTGCRRWRLADGSFNSR